MRASSIRDPIERLRYLSRATGHGHPRTARRGRTMLLLFPALLAPLVLSDATVRPKPAPPLPHPAPMAGEPPDVWLVERNDDFETYSNGLRIENRSAVANQPRLYTRIDRRQPDSRLWQTSSVPAGIVFHATESYQAPFEPAQNRVLQQTGESLLGFIRNQRAYHFVIDRFGRVHRVVMETDAANHAGRSVWADRKWIYMNLNSSFLGVAFEAQTPAGQETVWTNKAQTHSAKILTEMLRSQYGIAAENCVTHAQVSVNPANMQAGYHTDFGNNFPFREIGLADNYARPLPSVCLFGFTYAPAFLKATGAPLWTSLALAEEQIREQAMACRLSPADYRQALQRQYRDLLMEMRSNRAMESHNE